MAEIVTLVALAERVCRDKDDDVVLATAVAGRATIIVSGDDLLVWKKFRGIRILSPRQFLEL
ncbi:MAG: putative toxin-antitoxin system toxin component, PIN family [Chthoniobacterales bacterium]